MTQLTLESERQEKLHQLQQSFIDLRFGMFIHFNMATFQNLEWGDPRGPTSLFNPTDLDTDQWIISGKAAGMTYACLTTKVSQPIPPLPPLFTISLASRWFRHLAHQDGRRQCERRRCRAGLCQFLPQIRHASGLVLFDFGLESQYSEF